MCLSPTYLPSPECCVASHYSLPTIHYSLFLFHEAANLQTKKRVGVRTHADLRVGSAHFSTSKTFVVDADVHRLYRTNFGIENKSHRHGIEEGGRLLAPFMIEQRQRIRERSPLFEEVGALGFVELQLRGIERHHVSGTPEKRVFWRKECH